MRARLPAIQGIFQVYAVIAVMLSAWTIPAFLWKLSAWLLILNMGEIVAIFGYSMAANLIESLVILLILLALCAFLPAHVLRDDFVVRGSILGAGLIGILMAFVESHIRLGVDSGVRLLIAPIIVLILIVVLLLLSQKNDPLRSAIAWISDRLTVFLYLLAPLYVLFLAYILFRNLV